jgi:hypothetical protein
LGLPSRTLRASTTRRGSRSSRNRQGPVLKSISLIKEVSFPIISPVDLTRLNQNAPKKQVNNLVAGAIQMAGNQIMD